ncbi:hypothetical protein [Lacinutrix chionoecetis]
MPELVPLGIADYNGVEGKDNITFEYEVSENDAKLITLQIRDGSTVIFEEIKSDPENITQGSHQWSWDGFDNNQILDTSALKAYKALNFYVKVEDDEGNEDFNTVDFKVSKAGKKWVDIKIDKGSKKINIDLRVNFKDGGAKGIDCFTRRVGGPRSSRTVTTCPWEKIPDSELNPLDPVLKVRNRSFQDLETLALEGLNYHWGRNNSHSEAKNVTIDGEEYQIFVNAINTRESAMDDVDLIFNTNRKWMRSGNPGTVEGIVSAVGNLVSREAVCYNVGYIKYSNGWGYVNANSEDIEFKMTSAHEIGHTILKAYGGTNYSYGHKGSVSVVTQSQSSDAKRYNKKGEIDIMPYYTDVVPLSVYDKFIASQEDVLSLIWLSKLEIE